MFVNLSKNFSSK